MDTRYSSSRKACTPINYAVAAHSTLYCEGSEWKLEIQATKGAIVRSKIVNQGEGMTVPCQGVKSYRKRSISLGDVFD